MNVSAAVVIVNFASAELLERNAARLDPPSDVLTVVVDCFSSATESKRIGEICTRHDWIPVLLRENAGFGGGTNAGAEVAIARGADVIVALNPDATISREALAALVTAASDDARALVSPHIVAGDGQPWFSGSDLYLDDGSIAGRARRPERSGRPRMEWATGACFAMSTALWRTVGGFDDEYFLYWEDVDLSRRVLDVGGRLHLLDVRAVHDEGQTHTEAPRSERAKSETYYYYNIRNRLIFAAKHLDAAALTRWRRSTPRVSWEIVMQGGRRQLISSVAPWRAWVRGMRDGLRYARGSGVTSDAP